STQQSLELLHVARMHRAKPLHYLGHLGLICVLQRLDQVISVLVSSGDELHGRPRSKRGVAESLADAEIEWPRVGRRVSRIARALCAFRDDVHLHLAILMWIRQAMPSRSRVRLNLESKAPRLDEDVLELPPGY